jgi:hypothetical protein
LGCISNKLIKGQVYVGGMKGGLVCNNCFSLGYGGM